MSKVKSIKLKDSNKNETVSNDNVQIEDKPVSNISIEINDDAELRSLEEMIDNSNPDNQHEHQYSSNGEEFLPLPPDYIIRQQQIATYQMLSEFLRHQDKNIAEVLNDVRISIDCLTKSVLQLNKNLDRHFSEVEKK